MVPHSHDDTGWQRTVDQYFWEEVQYTYSSVVEELARHPDRTFVFVEIACTLCAAASICSRRWEPRPRHFRRANLLRCAALACAALRRAAPRCAALVCAERALVVTPPLWRAPAADLQRWWELQSDETRATVRRLVDAGQVEVVNGGWCMADEANPTMYAATKQISEGHQWVKANLNATVRAGYHIDPFGAGGGWPAIFADMGYDAFIGNRIDSMLKTAWKEDKHLEFLWRPSPSRGVGGQVWTHILDDHYSAFGGFDWEYFSGLGGDDITGATESPALVAADGKASFFDKPNLARRATLWAIEAQVRASGYSHGKLLVLHGDDFKFQTARKQYNNLDMLLAAVNTNTSVHGVTAHYSTISQYVDAVAADNATWPVYGADLMPYATGNTSYWTGYYTSRPLLKGTTAAAGGAMQAAEAAVASASAAGRLSVSTQTDRLTVVRRATSVSMHHDAITGTSLPPVVDDFVTRTSVAAQLARDSVADAVSAVIDTGDVPLSASPASAIAAVAAGKPASVVLWNGLGWSTTQPVTIAGLSTSQVVVRAGGASGDGALLPSQTTPASGGTFDLTFVATVPQLGFAAFTLQPSSSAPAPSALHPVPRGSTPSISAGGTTVTFDAATGLLSGVAAGGAPALPLSHNFMRLNATADACNPYVFAPVLNDTAHPVNPAGATSSGGVGAPLLVAGGAVFEEALQTFVDGSISQRVRVYAGLAQPMVELVANVSVPWNDTELLSTIETPLRNVDGAGRVEFIADSTTVEMMRRTTNHTGWQLQNASWPGMQGAEPVAGNFYPSASTSSIVEPSSGLRLGLLADRARGVASLSPGSLTALVHRRCAEEQHIPLWDTTHIESRQLLVVGNDTVAMAALRTQAPRMYAPLVPLFAGKALAVANASFMAAALPDNMHLLSLEAGLGSAVPQPSPSTAAAAGGLRAGEARALRAVEAASCGTGATVAVLRLQHLFGVGEHPVLSQPATVDLAALFDPQRLVLEAVVETQLSAVTPLSAVHRVPWHAQDGRAAPATRGDAVAVGTCGSPLGSTHVTLAPLEVRTFAVSLAAA